MAPAPPMASSAPVASAPPVATPAPAAPAPVPAAAAAVASLASSEPVRVADPVPVPAALPVAAPVPVEALSREEERVERQAEVTLPSPVFETTSESDTAVMQRAAVEALAAAGQGSAADAMGDAVWTLAGGEVRVQTELSKTMLPVVMNPDAEKTARAALREVAGAVKMALLPGAAKPSAEKKVKVARAGSAQAKALEHPMVQEAQKLFGAEIQTVIDLSE